MHMKFIFLLGWIFLKKRHLADKKCKYSKKYKNAASKEKTSIFVFV